MGHDARMSATDPAAAEPTATDPTGPATLVIGQQSGGVIGSGGVSAVNGRSGVVTGLAEQAAAQGAKQGARQRNIAQRFGAAQRTFGHHG